MEKRQDRRSQGSLYGVWRTSVDFFRNYKSWTNAQFIIVLLLAVALSMGGNLLVRAVQGSKGTSPGSQTLDSASTSGQSKEDQSGETTARIMAMVTFFIISLSTEQLLKKMGPMISMKILSM